MDLPPPLARGARVLGSLTPLRPRVLVVLGSGLGALAASVGSSVSIGLSELPGMPAAAVQGHEGTMLVGRLEGVPVWVQAGRLHLFEGHAARTVSAPLRMVAALGVETVVVTNAAGGIRWDLAGGSLVLLDDLLNLSFRDPLEAAASESGVRGGVGRGVPRTGPDPGRPFDALLSERVLAEATGAGIRLHRGVYAGVLGPSFETRAEIRMLGRLGGDVVGMSTVPEVLAARARGLRVLGLSLVTNRAAGLRRARLSHAEVVEAAAAWGHRMEAVVRTAVRSARRPA